MIMFDAFFTSLCFPPIHICETLMNANAKLIYTYIYICMHIYICIYIYIYMCSSSAIHTSLLLICAHIVIRKGASSV